MTVKPIGGDVAITISSESADPTNGCCVEGDLASDYVDSSKKALKASGVRVGNPLVIHEAFGLCGGPCLVFRH